MNIIGHKKIITFFEKAIRNETLGHAYIFSGPAHLGKFSLAMELAKTISGSDSNINPDIIVLSLENAKEGSSLKNSIKIDEIRELTRQLSLTAYSGKTKVAIIDGAETLNKSAQNALLKTLEEPPANSAIFLITEDKGKLLPTIISRCQIKKFNLVSEEEISSMIPIDTENREDIIFWSMGRPGMAKILFDDKEEFGRKQQAMRDFENLSSENIAKKFLLAENLSKNSTNHNLAEIIDDWIIISREIILGNNIKMDANNSKALRILEKLNEAKETIKNTNSNTRLVLENLFLEF